MLFLTLQKQLAILEGERETLAKKVNMGAIAEYR
jgi:hypothetical protein